MPSGTCLDSTDTPAQGTYPREQQGGFELEEILLSPHEAIRDVYYPHPPPYPACASQSGPLIPTMWPCAHIPMTYKHRGHMPAFTWLSRRNLNVHIPLHPHWYPISLHAAGYSFTHPHTRTLPSSHMHETCLHTCVLTYATRYIFMHVAL